MQRTEKKVIALALDGPAPALLDRWMSSGALPNLQRLGQEGLVVNVVSEKSHSNEHCWLPVLTGQKRGRWDHWLDSWDPERYRFAEASLYDWLSAPLFYALGDACRVVAFDMAAPVTDGIVGVQVSGFAPELNESYPESRPPDVLPGLLARYGMDPKAEGAKRVINSVSGREGISWVVPNLYQPGQVEAFCGSLIRSIERRTLACLELMQTQPWDLFLAAYSELHTAGHMAWHLSQPHPLNVLRHGERDVMLEIYQAVDQSIGRLVDKASPDTQVVFFSLDAIVPDCLENARAVFLPEFLYRWNFPGKAALAWGDAGLPPPSPRLDYSQHWKHEIWKLRTPVADEELESPQAQEAAGDPMSWCPGNWYRPLWPSMQAFALPSVADGYVRLNVAGRETSGVVDPEAFIALCDELSGQLRTLIDARSGEPLVREVIRVRSNPFDADPKKPPADLIVVFQESRPVDVVDSPLWGRVGPIPYFRTGSHQAHGGRLENLMIVCGSDLRARGAATAIARLEDIPATLLDLLGLQPLTPRFDGVTVLAPGMDRRPTT